MNVLIYEPMPMSAVSYYRSIGVLSYLSRKNSNIKLLIPKQISWNVLTEADILYMQRPQHIHELQALEMAKNFNVKTWVDYDDLLHEVPPGNPLYLQYQDKELRKRIERTIIMSDVVTVSTKKIKEFYVDFNENIHIIPNAHNDYVYAWNKITDPVFAVNWRGSNTHFEDLLSVAKTMFIIAKNQPKLAWTFIGNDIHQIIRYIERKFNFGECDAIDYNKFILDLKSAIQIAPLALNKFNEAKSNISWIEGTFAGSTTVAPDMLEFDRPGVIKYKPTDLTKFDPFDFDNHFKENQSFGYQLERTIRSKEYRQKNYIESYEYIKENLMLSKINDKRIEIIESLR